MGFGNLEVQGYVEVGQRTRNVAATTPYRSWYVANALARNRLLLKIAVKDEIGSEEAQLKMMNSGGKRALFGGEPTLLY